MPIKCHFLSTKCDFRVAQSYFFLHERRGKSKQCQTMAFWHPYSRLILFLPCLVFCGPLTKENEKPCLQLLQESRQRKKDFFLPSFIYFFLLRPSYTLSLAHFWESDFANAGMPHISACFFLYVASYIRQI